jgi:hypothetical protein
MGVPLDERERKAVPGNLNRLIVEEGVGPPEMWRVVAEMARAFGAGRTISPQQALRAVRGERAFAFGGVPGGKGVPRNSIAVVGATEEDYREEDYNFHV